MHCCAPRARTTWRRSPLPRTRGRGRGRRGVGYGLALIDLSTGEFATTQIEGADAGAKLLDELQRVQASEVVLPPSLINDEEFVARLKAIRPARLSPIEEHACEVETARRPGLISRGWGVSPSSKMRWRFTVGSGTGAALHYL